ncbi:MAG: energy transducer TonB [Bacteroidales bacterium]|nr:energy transducer TonB [Candidatus Colimorpha pelethequi]
METKKTSRADLENKKGLCLEVGFIVILVASLLAFNLKSYNRSEIEIVPWDPESEIDYIPDVTTPTPPPPAKLPDIVVTDINRVDNSAVVEDVFVNVDDNANMAQDEYIPPALPEEEEVVVDDYVLVAEKEPEFPGGVDALYAYLRDHIKYPTVAKETGITGKVYVSFIVEKDGSITDLKLMRDIGGGCGQEALRVVRSMPKWTPGKQQGRAVRVKFNLPISFNLQ